MKTVLNAAVTAAIAVLVSQSTVAADSASPNSLAVQYSSPYTGTSKNLPLFFSRNVIQRPNRVSHLGTEHQLRGRAS